MADEERRSETLIARADGVVGANTQNLVEVLGDQSLSIFGWVQVPNGKRYAFVDQLEDVGAEPGVPRLSRWTAQIDNGVLTVSAWRDSQDRDSEQAGAVLAFAQGGWAEFVPYVRYLDDDLKKPDEA